MAKFDEIIQASIALSNYDAQQREFFKQTKGLSDPRAKEIYGKLEKRLEDSIIDYVETNLNL